MSDNGYATAADILGRSARAEKDVTVDGLKCRIQSLNGGEWLEYSTRVNSASERDGTRRGSDLMRAAQCWLIRTMLLNPVLSDDDAEKLHEVQPTLFAGLLNECINHSGVGDTDTEDQAKN